MIETMHKQNGVGLAAVQVGILKRVVVIDLYDDKGPIVLINPVIVKTTGEQEVEEGCLSFPNEFAKVVRPAEVTAEYTDREGKRMRVDLYDDKGPIVLINPIIIKTKGEQEVEEGCLSFPNEFAKVVRPAEVTAEYTDREGKRMRVKAKELLAQAICHELDHLDGELFIDKIVPGTLEYIDPNSSEK